MWKYQPVVGTSVTGLRTQIIDGRNGFIADDTEACARATLKLFQDRDLWHKLGKQAYARIRKNYFLPMMVLQYIGALTKACGKSQEPLLVRGT
jgi:trehalose synthase